MADTNEKVSFSAPRGIVAMLLAAVFGISGGIGIGCVNPASASQVSRAEVTQIASVTSHESSTAVREDCRREAAVNMANLKASLDRIELMAVKLAADSEQLKIDVAKIQSRGR